MGRSSSISRRYAEAYFNLAREAGDIDVWRRELALLAGAFNDPNVSAALVNPRLPIGQRTRLGLRLVEGLSDPARNLGRLLIERRRSTVLNQVLDHYDRLADSEAGVVRAEVTTAIPVDRQAEERIAASLAVALGGPVQTVVHSDPSIVGGLVIRIGDRVIDDSVRTHLQQLQAALA